MASILYKIIKINLLVLLFIIGAVPLLLAKHSKAEPSIQDKFNSITPAQLEAFNIKVNYWKNAVPDNPATTNDESFPGFAFIVFCRSCANAIYHPTTGELTNPTELPKIATSALLMVPDNWNKRLIVAVPPGPLTHVTAFNQLPWLNTTLLKEGYAIGTMNNPPPGFEPGFPYDLFIGPPYSTNDFRNEYFATGHMFKDLMAEVFGKPVGTYGHSRSRGTLSGTGLLLAEHGNPFDGFVIASGANGNLDHLMGHIEAFAADPQRVPLTHRPLSSSEDTPPEQVSRLVLTLGIADPEYRAFILSAVNADGSPDFDEQLARGLAYNIQERPAEVQRSWADLEYGTDLQKKTIYFQGLKDGLAFPEGVLTFFQNVIAAEKTDLFRLYPIKNLTHGNPVDPPALWPTTLPIDALHALDAWVQNGAEPPALNAGSFNIDAPDKVESCTKRDNGIYKTDPMGCFCDEMGGEDFSGQPIPGCNP